MKDKGKLLRFEHSFQHMKATRSLKVGLERNRHRQKGMHLKELKTPLHHTGKGVSLVCPNTKEEIGKQIRWKG